MVFIVTIFAQGGVETPMIHRIEENTFGDTKTHEECEEIFGAAYLDKRYCKPEEVADLALFLGIRCIFTYYGIRYPS